jgi:hypothetical protein
MYDVAGSRPDTIVLVFFVMYDLMKVRLADKIRISNSICSPFQNLFEIGFHESLIPVALVSGSSSNKTGPDGAKINIKNILV